MPTPAGPKLEFLEASETTISIQFKPVSSVGKYELEWKLVEHEWTSPIGKTTVKGEGKLLKAEAVDLDPGMTYCLRAFCLGADGSKGHSAGPELIMTRNRWAARPRPRNRAVSYNKNRVVR